MTEEERRRLDRIAEAVVHLDTMQDVLADTVKTLASKEQVDKIEAIQLGDHADIAVLKEHMRSTNEDRPSWSWINPVAWWARAGSDGAGRALVIFRQLVFLAAALWVLYRVVLFAERYVEAIERRATAEEVQAGRPTTTVVVPPVALPDSAN